MVKQVCFIAVCGQDGLLAQFAHSTVLILVQRKLKNWHGLANLLLTISSPSLLILSLHSLLLMATWQWCNQTTRVKWLVVGVSLVAEMVLICWAVKLSGEAVNVGSVWEMIVHLYGTFRMLSYQTIWWILYLLLIYLTHYIHIYSAEVFYSFMCNQSLHILYILYIHSIYLHIVWIRVVFHIYQCS